MIPRALFGAVVLLIGCCIAAYPKQQHLSYEGIDNRYELTFDDSRISSEEMRQIACLSPYIEVYCAPFYIGSDSERRAGKVVVDKVFFAPPLDLCIDQPCKHDPEVADGAFLKYAAVHNLRCGRERRPQRYPMDAWKRFIKEYGITERRRFEDID